MNPTVLCTTARQDPNKGFFETAGDACLSPFRYLLNGKMIEVRNARDPIGKALEVPSFYTPKSSITVSNQLSTHPDASAIACVLVVPGIFAGFLLKSFALIVDPNAQKAHTSITNHYHAE